MAEERDSFIFYKSYETALKSLSDKMQLRVLKAVISYALHGEEPCLDGVELAIFELMRPQIKANNRRYENGKKGAEFGRLGGRPPKNSQGETPKKPQENPDISPDEPQPNPTETPNVNVNVNVNDNVNVKDKKKNIQKEKKFIKPTLEEITDYCLERQNSVDPQRFYDFYESKGWKVGNTPMKDWKAAVRTWERGDGRGSQNISNGRSGVLPPNDDFCDIVIR